jgi:L-alanine-DL-glutamate epimerase-like enolase superfamily enzyme
MPYRQSAARGGFAVDILTRHRYLASMNLTWQRITAHTTWPFRIARPGSSVSADGTEVQRIAVRIEHDGIVGEGEAAPVAYYHQTLESVEATLTAVGPLLGDDPGDIDGIVDRLLERFDDQRATVAAIDAALHDWLGKARGKPLWKILGLDPARTPPTSMTIGIDKPELLTAKVEAAKGFRILKVKVGTPSDVETLTILRRLAPAQKIRVDANCGWGPDEIVERIEKILPFDLELIEQPTAAGSYDAVRKARARSPIPLVADEDSRTPEDVPRLHGVFDGINIKLSKCGGVREARRMIAAARQRGMKIMLGCMVETSLGVAPAAHLASEVDYVDLDGHLLLRDDPYTGLRLEGDIVRPGDDPGLGVRRR